MVLEDDGHLLSATIMAGSLAMYDAGVPLTDLVTSCGLICLGEEITPSGEAEVVPYSGRNTEIAMPYSVTVYAELAVSKKVSLFHSETPHVMSKILEEARSVLLGYKAQMWACLNNGVRLAVQ